MPSAESPWITVPALDTARAHRLLECAVADPPALATAASVAHAATLLAPMTLLGPRPAARLHLARALHHCSGRPGPLLLPTAGLTVPETPAGTTILLDAMPQTKAEAVALECLLADGAVWVLVGADDVDAVPSWLRARVTALTWSVGVAAAHQHADRTAALLAEVAALAPLPRPTLSPAALAWLASQPWRGDEDAVRGRLLRALVAAGPGAGTLEPTHLAGPGEQTAVVTEAGEPEPADPHLEYLVAELAHELRNPLVTLKTVADHLGELARDEELRSRFGELASDAVGRMDALLDNLVAFSRLGPPQPRATDIDPVLEQVMAEANGILSERAIEVRRSGQRSAQSVVDPEHLAYALKNLLLGVAQEAAPSAPLVLDTSLNGVVRVRFTAEHAGARLRELVLPDGHPRLDDPTFLPLAFSLARTVLMQAGGRLEMAAAAEGTTALEVHLPPTGAARGPDARE